MVFERSPISKNWFLRVIIGLPMSVSSVVSYGMYTKFVIYIVCIVCIALIASMHGQEAYSVSRKSVDRTKEIYYHNP